MNLVLDIGNTRVKSGLFNGNDLVSHQIFEFNPEQIWAEIHKNNGPAIISSVINDDSFLSKLKDFPSTMVFNAQTKIPLKNAYKTPDTLGKDRLANAVALYSIYRGKNALSIDCGTCLKFDAVINSQYIGGSIAPGLTMRFKALHTFTGKLPFIETNSFLQLVGQNTEESILSGCYNGMLTEINGFIDQYKQEYGDLEICITGGEHHFFADRFKNCIFADPFLTLKGLNEILLFQNN